METHLLGEVSAQPVAAEEIPEAAEEGGEHWGVGGGMAIGVVVGPGSSVSCRGVFSTREMVRRAVA